MSSIASSTSQIAKSLDKFAEEVVTIVPHLSSLFKQNVSDSFPVFLGRKFVRDMAINIMSDSPLSPEQFVEKYVAENSPIHITIDRTDADMNSLLLDFFRSVTSDGAFIEMYGTIKKKTIVKVKCCGQPNCPNSTKTKMEDMTPDDINLDSDVITLPNVQYLVYLPVKSLSGDQKYIKFDILYHTNDLDANARFTIDRLTYPIKKLSFNKVSCSIIDIEAKRLMDCSPSMSDDYTSIMRTLYDACDLFEEGFRFDNDGYFQRLYGSMITNTSSSSTINILRNDALTSVPSRNINSNCKLVSLTLHKSQVVTLEYLKARVLPMLEKTPLPLRFWNLPETGTDYGITMDSVTVYKGATCRLFTQKKLSYKDVLSNNVSKFTLVVELEIPPYTRFFRTLDNGYMKYRFETAVVKAFHSYHKRRIDERQIVVLSDYDSDFEYVVGNTITPRKPFDSSSRTACSSGIHAFLDVNTVWSYFDNKNALVNYTPMTLNVTVLSTNDGNDSSDVETSDNSSDVEVE